MSCMEVLLQVKSLWTSSELVTGSQHTVQKSAGRNARKKVREALAMPDVTEVGGR